MLPERIFIIINLVVLFYCRYFTVYVMETFIRINELIHGLEIKGLEKQGFRHKDLMTMHLLYWSSSEIFHL